MGEEYHNSPARYYMVGSLDSYVDHYCAMRSRFVHEILCPGKPCRLGFDIETTVVKTEEVLAAAQRIVNMIGKEPVLLDATRTYTLNTDNGPMRVCKTSLHLIFPDVVLPTPDHVYWYIMQQLRDPSEYFVDVSVFRRSPGSLRLAYSSSFNSQHVLVPRGQDQRVPVDRGVLLKSMLCLPGITPNTDCYVPIPIALRSAGGADRVDDAYHVSAAEVGPLYINAKYGGAIKVKRAHTLEREKPNDVCFYVDMPCPYAGRRHKRNNGLFVFELIDPRYLDKGIVSACGARVYWDACVRTRYVCMDNECSKREQDGTRLNSGVMREPEADERLLTAMIYGGKTSSWLTDEASSSPPVVDDAVDSVGLETREA